MILTADRVIFGDSATPPAPLALRLEGKTITHVAPLWQLQKEFPDETVREYAGATILPGLIDMHTHICHDGAPQEPGMNDYLWVLYAHSRLSAALRSGVTTARDLGSPDGLGTAIQRAAAQGLIQVPRLFTANQAICMTGGHGYDNGICVERDGVEEIRREVRNQIKKGVQWIKIMDSHGWRGQEYSQEELDAAVEEAHRFGVPIAAHAGWEPSVEMCVKAGFDTIEHGTSTTLDHARTMKETGQTLVPTILAFSSLYDLIRDGGDFAAGAAATYAAPALEKCKNVKQFYDAGVRVCCGTDMVIAGKPPLPVALEAKCMVDIGMTPLQAIETATKNGGDALGMGDRLGQIQPGYLADILVVEGNPVEDIDALQQVKVVYFEGQLVQ